MFRVSVLPMPATPPEQLADARAALKAATTRYRKTRHQGTPATRKAATDALYAAITTAVHAGMTQAEACRLTGFSTPHVCRLVRGVSSGKVRPPASSRRLLEERLPVAEITARYEAGESSHRLAAAYGCSAQSITNLLEKHGIPRRLRGRITLPVPSSELVRRYTEDRQQIQQIAADLGVAGHLISRRLAEAGVRVPRGQRRLALPDQTIVDRYLAGETVKALSLSYGVSSPAITLRLRSHGVYDPPGHGAHVRAEQAREVFRRYRAGEQVSALAIEFGKSPGTLYEWIKGLKQKGN